MIERTFAHAAFWSYGLSALVFIGFAIRLSLGWQRFSRAAILVAVIVASAFWALTTIIAVAADQSGIWFVVATLDAVRYALWFVFLANLSRGIPGTKPPLGPPSLLPVPWWFAAPIALALAATIWLFEIQPLVPPIEGPSRVSTFGVRVGLAIVGLVLIEQLIRRVHAHARWGIKPLCLGLAGMFAFDLYLYSEAMIFGVVNFDTWIARGIVAALIIPFIAVSTARNPEWKVDIHISRGAVFHTTAVLLSGVFLMAIGIAGYSVRYLGGEWGRVLQAIFLFAAILTTILVVSSGRFRSELRVFVSKHFFSYRYDYREEWLRFTRTLSGEGSIQGVRERSIEAIANLVESPAGMLWLKGSAAEFRVAARWNMQTVEATEAADGPLVRFLESSDWVVNLHDHRAIPPRDANVTLPRWLTSIPEAWLAVPLLSGSELIGFVVLADARASVELNWEVLDLLKTASRQAASYLGQIQATEALLESRKFDAFARMSAFVVHDLKNLVSQLSLLLKNADRHRSNPEFQRDMLTTVAHVVARMNHLVLQLRAEDSPVENPRLTDIGSIVRRVCATRSESGTTIALDLEPNLLAIAHEDRLDHVVGHLLQNAQDATSVSGDIRVSLRSEQRFVVLEVSDTGVGMTPEFLRDRLFRPFETTKTSGMGIGVYESTQYIEALGGRIVIESTFGSGTQVRVYLPQGGLETRDASESSEIA